MSGWPLDMVVRRHRNHRIFAAAAAAAQIRYFIIHEIRDTECAEDALKAADGW